MSKMLKIQDNEQEMGKDRDSNKLNADVFNIE